MSVKSDTFLDDKKSQEKLEEELGAGVEKEPKLPEKPKLEKVNLDLTGALDTAAILAEISKLPDPDKADELTNRHDKYEATAKRIWVIKKAAENLFPIELRMVKGEETSPDGRIVKLIWERGNDGKLITETKKFYFTGMTIQEKDEHFRLIADRESKSYALNRIGEKLKMIAKKEESTLTPEEKSLLDDRAWIDVAMEYNKANQDYYLSTFQAYFGATGEEMKRIDFRDIINHVEIGIYIEGVKSPS